MNLKFKEIWCNSLTNNMKNDEVKLVKGIGGEAAVDMVEGVSLDSMEGGVVDNMEKGGVAVDSVQDWIKLPKLLKYALVQTLVSKILLWEFISDIKICKT